MSYMSDVKVVISKRNWDEVTEKLKSFDMKEEDEYDLNKFLTQVKINFLKSNPNVIILCWDYFKWDYDTNAIVAYFEDYLMNMRFTEKMPFQFIRVGEGVGSQTDIQEKHYYGEEDEFAQDYDLFTIEVKVNAKLKNPIDFI